jgi:hypothetical protein
MAERSRSTSAARPPRRRDLGRLARSPLTSAAG